MEKQPSTTQETTPELIPEPAPETLAHQAAIRELAANLGNGFHAYLQIADPDLEPLELREDYLNRYRGEYEDFEDFARTRITEIGLTRLSEQLNVKLSDDNPANIYMTSAHLRRLYHGITIDSMTYVFVRDLAPEADPYLDAYLEPLQIDPLIHKPEPRAEISWPGDVGPKPESRRHLRILQDLYDSYNSAFEVYLRHIWKDTPIEEIENDMLDVYQGSYSSVAEFIDDFTEAMGWRGEIDRAMSDAAIPPGSVGWNYRAMYQDLRRDYEFHQRGRQVHVFLK